MAHRRHPASPRAQRLRPGSNCQERPERLTGGEIERAFIEALYQAFDEETEPTDLTVAQVVTDLAPLSKLMAGQIATLRNWARGRARRATAIRAERRGEEDGLGILLRAGASDREVAFGGLLFVSSSS